MSNAAIVSADHHKLASPVTGAVGLFLRRPDVGQRIVVFCADNEVTQTAVDMVALLARAGRDQVFLVTVVPTVLQQAQGNQLLIRYYQQLSQVLIQVRIRASPSVAFDPSPPDRPNKCVCCNCCTPGAGLEGVSSNLPSRNIPVISIQAKMDVVVKGYAGLLDCLESYVDACEATLVIMGSQAITSQPIISGTTASAAVVGSVTLSCIKRLAGMPMLVVTANTRLVQLNERGMPVKQLSGSGRQSGSGNGNGPSLMASGKREAPRVLAVVEAHSKPMLQFLCSSCLVSFIQFIYF